MAIHGAYDYLKSITDGHDARVRSLEEAAHADFETSSLADLKKEVTALRVARNAIQRWRFELDDLKRLSREFEGELTALGVELGAMRNDVSELQKRVSALEGRGGKH